MEAQSGELVPGNQGAVLSSPLHFNDEPTQEMVDSHFFNSNLLSVYGSNDAPLFKPTEVCGFLYIKNHRAAICRLADDEKVQCALHDPRGVLRAHTLINEPGLYALLQQSQKAEAKAFKRWLNHVVLPFIRKTGSYSLKRKRDDDLDRINKELAIWARVGGLQPRDEITFQDRLRALNTPWRSPKPVPSGTSTTTPKNTTTP